MKTNFLKLFAVFTVLFSVVVLADSTFAQPRRARGKVFTKAEVQQVIKRVETRVDSFVKQYDKSLDNSSLNGSNKEDWLNKRAKDLEKATDELRREFDKRDAWIENKDEVRKCMNIATDIDKNMKNKRYGAATEGNWKAVVFELNTLAKLYNVPQVGSSAY
jgi:Skp family chaperone for outer membrane proteins